MLKMMTFSIAIALSTACSKKAASCEDIYEHTKSLAPPEMREMFEKKKASAIEKCSKLSDGAKQCAMDAKTMEELQKCPRD